MGFLFEQSGCGLHLEAQFHNVGVRNAHLHTIICIDIATIKQFF